MAWIRRGVLGVALGVVVSACDPAEDGAAPVIEADAAAGGAVGCEGVALPEGDALDAWAGAVLDVPEGGTRLLFSQGGDHGALCSAMHADLCTETSALPANLEIDLAGAIALGTTIATDARWIEGDCECCTAELAAETASVDVTLVTDTCVAGRVELTGGGESATGSTFTFAIPRC